MRAQLEVERVELNVRIDARWQALYAQAKFDLRNHGPQSPDIVEFNFPAPLSPRLEIVTVWDRKGELPWRSDPVKEDTPRKLLVALRSPLAPEKKLALVVSYDLDLKDYAPPGAAVSVSSKSARLSTTGWYPLPARSDPALPRTLRLAVRLPKEWRVEAPVELKQLRDGTTLASYELELEPVEPSQLLFRAGSGLPP